MFSREDQLLPHLEHWLLRELEGVRLVRECVVPWGKIDLLAIAPATRHQTPATLLAFELKLSRGVDVLIQARNNRALCRVSHAVLPLLAAERIQQGDLATEYLDAGVGILGIADDGHVVPVLEYRPAPATTLERRLFVENEPLRQKILARAAHFRPAS